MIVRKSVFCPSLLAGLIVAALFAVPAQAATLVVGGTCHAGVQFSTIHDAVKAAPVGSNIYICPNTYPEQVTITKRLSLIGVSSNGLTGAQASGPNNPVILSPSGGVSVNASDLYNNFPIAAQIAVLTPGGNVNISNITVDGSNNGLNSCATNLVGIYYQNASGKINEVVSRYQELPQADFGCQDGLAIFVQSGYGSGGTANVTISNSSVHDYDKNGITADGSGTVATISGNYVVGIGATSLIAQNGIQLSDGATGKILNNAVSDDVYVNSPNCQSNNSCTSATGILLYDSGGTSSSHVTVSGNTVSNTQGAIVAFGDSAGTADFNDVSSNKITTSPAAGPFLLDGIDLCSNNNSASSNAVYNSSGAGVHIDSQCTESTGTSGNNTSVTSNTVNEACAGVLTGNGTSNTVSGTVTYNVIQTTYAGDSCPAGTSRPKVAGKIKPQPKH